MRDATHLSCQAQPIAQLPGENTSANRNNRPEPSIPSVSNCTMSIEIITEMARVTGLEPATSGVTGRHSNQLSYTRALWCKIPGPKQICYS